MGAILTTLINWVSPTADSGADQIPDPATGLSELDRQLIRDTWSLVADKKTIKQNGVEFFVQLFQTYPHMQGYFKQFDGLSTAELRQSPKMRAHALGVMNMFTAYVQNLEDVETLVALVQKMAISHYKRGIKVPDFEKLKDMLPSYLKSVLGNKLTKEAEGAWVRLMTTHNAVLRQTMESPEVTSNSD